jgi:3-dehydroquinate dehydratase-2
MSKPKRASRALPRRVRNILLLHGPNLNLLGTREPGIYGTDTFKNINERLTRAARRHGASLEIFQSNHEGALIERVHAAKTQRISWIIVNPAGLTHTSVALRDALAAVRIRFIEVHLSNIHSREPFRRYSYFSDLAVGTICGLGSRGYDFALQFALQTTGK